MYQKILTWKDTLIHFADHPWHFLTQRQQQLDRFFGSAPNFCSHMFPPSEWGTDAKYRPGVWKTSEPTRRASMMFDVQPLFPLWFAAFVLGPEPSLFPREVIDICLQRKSLQMMKVCSKSPCFKRGSLMIKPVLSNEKNSQWLESLESASKHCKRLSSSVSLDVWRRWPRMELHPDWPMADRKVLCKSREMMLQNIINNNNNNIIITIIIIIIINDDDDDDNNNKLTAINPPIMIVADHQEYLHQNPGGMRSRALLRTRVPLASRSWFMIGHDSSLPMAL